MCLSTFMTNLIHSALVWANYHCINIGTHWFVSQQEKTRWFQSIPYAEGKILAWDYTCKNTLAVIKIWHFFLENINPPIPSDFKLPLVPLKLN